MADIDSGDILRVGAGLFYDSFHDVVNVWHIYQECGAGQTWAAGVSMIQFWLNAIYSEIDTPLSADIGTGDVSVQNLTQGTTLGTIAWSPTWSGGDAGDATAAGVCCFAWARTYKPRVQIRKYFGVFGEANVSGGVWTPTVRNACNAALLYAITPHTISAFSAVEAVAYDRLLGTYEFAYNVDTAAEPAYQRRRKRGRGS